MSPRLGTTRRDARVGAVGLESSIDIRYSNTRLSSALFQF
jgi:hypothetical protein